MKNGIIAYLSHKRTQNARNKKIMNKKIIFFDIMKPLKGALTTPNKTANQKNTKKGLISWKTKTLKRMNLLH
ncbi:type I restriction endonuclease subunit M [Helicobacter pylori]|uniref:type I restriction endonuclease subunit M n=1 Tax=Helicobacter pylori TaxID=210 RepID=UPI000D3D0C43|nr:type I restriction endonuclease subunit M [Helicobacter pylori]PUD78600.1 type I restriction endonuclease subunit M [Helicobacter pylori]